MPRETKRAGRTPGARPVRKPKPCERLAAVGSCDPRSFRWSTERQFDRQTDNRLRETSTARTSPARAAPRSFGAMRIEGDQHRGLCKPAFAAPTDATRTRNGRSANRSNGAAALRNHAGGRPGGYEARLRSRADYVTVATCTAVPLLTLLVVTTTVRLPAFFGLVENVTVIEVALAEVTVPTAPSLSTTVLLPGVE